MATRINLFVDQGSDYRSTVQLEDENGPIDLTSYTARGSFREHYSSLTAYPINIGLSNTGVVELQIPASLTSGIRAKRYVYDIELVSSANVVSRIIEGILTINPEVTR